MRWSGQSAEKDFSTLTTHQLRTDGNLLNDLPWHAQAQSIEKLELRISTQQNMKSRLLLAAAAVLGLGVGQTASTVQQLRPTEQRQLAAVNNGQSTRQIEEDHFGGYAGGMLRTLMRDCGNRPDDWGRSAACARMVRKNKMRRLGIGGARI